MPSFEELHFACVLLSFLSHLFTTSEHLQRRCAEWDTATFPQVLKPLSCYSVLYFTLICFFSRKTLEVNHVQRKSFGLPAHSQQLSAYFPHHVKHQLDIKMFLVEAQRPLFNRKNDLLHTKFIGDCFYSKYGCEWPQMKI